MARKRMIDPTIWADEDFGTLSSDAMVMYMGLISNADDEGRLPGNPLYLSSTILPYRGLSPKQSQIIRDEILSKMKSVILYVVDNKEYIQLKNWASYQSINRPTPSKYPPLTEDSLSTHGGLTTNRIEKNRIEKNRIEENNASFELNEWISVFNKSFCTRYTSTDALSKNYEYWRKSYGFDDLKKAAEKARYDSYWGDKMTPVIFFRTTDKNKQTVDRIGDFLNLRIAKDAFSKIYKKMNPPPSDPVEAEKWVQAARSYLEYLNS